MMMLNDAASSPLCSPLLTLLVLQWMKNDAMSAYHHKSSSYSVQNHNVPEETTTTGN